MLLREQESLILKNQTTAPVKTVKLAHELGLKVYRTSDLPNNVSGMIKRDERLGGSSGYAVFVNENHAEVRRRFTIAHEIAHFILHKKLIGDGIVEDALLRSDALSNAIERQANKMAADILMPWHLILDAKNRDIETIGELATLFDVSKDAMSFRLLGVPYSTAKDMGHS